MSGIHAWLGNTRALADWRDDIDRAYDTARTLTDKSVSITIYRPGTGYLDAQTVRVEIGGNPSAVRSANVVSEDKMCYVLGYKGHPTITDTDIRRQDSFYLNEQKYTVTAILAETPDRLLAACEASETG